MEPSELKQYFMKKTKLPGQVDPVLDPILDKATFDLDKREQYNGGYHGHIKILKGGKYVRSGYLITKKGKKIYVTKHGNSGNALFDIKKRKNAVIEDLKKHFSRYFSGIPDDNWLTPSEDSELLYELTP